MEMATQRKQANYKNSILDMEIVIALLVPKFFIGSWRNR
jgi:hypothetical protein